MHCYDCACVAQNITHITYVSTFYVMPSNLDTVNVITSLLLLENHRKHILTRTRKNQYNTVQVQYWSLKLIIPLVGPSTYQLCVHHGNYTTQIPTSFWF